MTKFFMLVFLFLSLVLASVKAQELNSSVIYAAARNADSTKIRLAVTAALQADYTNPLAIDNFIHYGISYMTFQENREKDAALYAEFKPYLDKIIIASPGILPYHLFYLSLATFSLSKDAPNIIIDLLEETKKMPEGLLWMYDNELNTYENKEEVYADMQTHLVSFFENSAYYDKNVVKNVYRVAEDAMSPYYSGCINLLQINATLKNTEKVKSYTEKVLEMKTDESYPYILAIYYFYELGDMASAKSYYQLGLKKLKDKFEIQQLKNNFKDIKF